MWFLEGVNLYSILCPHKVKEYANDHFSEFKRGDFIYFKDDTAQSIYMVGKGKVKLAYYAADGTEVVKAVLTKGEIFGEMALLGQEKRNEFAVSVKSGTTICPLKVDQMQDMMRKNERFSVQIYKLIGLRLRKLERRLELLFFKDTRTRLLDFLKECAQELGKQKEGGIIYFENPYTQKDIADLVGARRETISAMLNDLKKEGTLDFDRKSMTILKPLKLTENTAI